MKATKTIIQTGGVKYDLSKFKTKKAKEKLPEKVLKMIEKTNLK